MWLVHDFNCCSAADMHYDIMKDRVKYLKESREGEAFMCKIMEEIREEGRAEGMEKGRAEIIFNMLENGKTPEEISDFAGIPLEQIKRVKEKLLLTV